MSLSAFIKKSRAVIGALARAAERDRDTDEAAQRLLYRAEASKELQFPKECLNFLHEMLRPVSVSASPVRKSSGRDEPGPRMLEALKLLVNLPPIPASVALEVALWADHLRGDFSSVDYTTEDLSTHFESISSLWIGVRTFFNRARAVRPESMLELGTAFGISAFYMMRAQEFCQKRPRLTTVEGFSPQKEMSAEFLSGVFGADVRILHGLKADVLPIIASGAETFDLFFHDGGHVGDAYIDDFMQLEPVFRPGAFVVYDDIRYDQTHTKSRRTCYEGWLEVSQHPRVRSARELSLNMGILELS